MKIAIVFFAVLSAAYCGLLAPLATVGITTGVSSQSRSQDHNGNYAFAYDENSSHGGSFRQEQGGHGVAVGSYGLRDADGRQRIVKYVADALGFRAQIQTNEPGIEAKDPAAVTIHKEYAPIAAPIIAAPAIATKIITPIATPIISSHSAPIVSSYSAPIVSSYSAPIVSSYSAQIASYGGGYNNGGNGGYNNGGNGGYNDGGNGGYNYGLSGGLIIGLNSGYNGNGNGGYNSGLNGGYNGGSNGGYGGY